MDLILLRHPALASAAGVCYGQSEVALAAPPDAEVARWLARLSPWCEGRPLQMHSSPLARCLQIAQPLARHFGTALRIDARLQEMHFGRWEMQAWDSVPRAELDAWAADLEQARPHGGESVAQLSERVAGWLGELEAACAVPAARPEAAPAAGLTLVLTHAGVMRVLAAQALRLPLAASLDWHLEPGALCHLRRRHDPAAGWTLVAWNG